MKCYIKGWIYDVVNDKQHRFDVGMNPTPFGNLACSEEPRQQSHTRLGIRELLEIQTLVNLVYAAAGKQYAPIMVPKPFELHWGEF
ncbi:hypothetical protein TI04_13300 [Achromatium sp. WMS2]|nr:hypothetical protein TI04_13300 [Achromatium sp. WMS2]